MAPQAPVRPAPPPPGGQTNKAVPATPTAVAPPPPAAPQNPGTVAASTPPQVLNAPAPAPTAEVQTITAADVGTVNAADLLEAPGDAAPAEGAKKKGGRKAVEKNEYPGTYQFNEDGSAATMVEPETNATIYVRVKLASVPTDFDRNKHKPLARKDFTTPALFCDWKAYEAQKTLEYWQKKAVHARAPESPLAKDKSKLARMQANMAKLQKEIDEQEAAEKTKLATASA